MSIVQPMSHTTANWHWKNKNIGPWARQWFQRELTAITITGDGEESVQITDVTEVDGDVELGQRKSKYVIVSFCIPFVLRSALRLIFT
jgi:activator of HSP90 ATPase